MTALTFIIAVIALVVSVLAYQRAEGSKDIKTQVNALRKKTADVLGKIEKELRKKDKKEGSPPGEGDAE